MKTVRSLLWLTAPLFLLVSVYVHVLTGNAGDKNWVLMATKMWLNGKVLYVDIFDVNPPLIYWLYAVPVYVSMHMQPLSDVYALAIAGLVMVAVVVAVSLRVIRYHPQFAESADRRKQFAWMLLFLFIFYTPNNFFFDREHILLVMAFPYILRYLPALARARLPTPLRIVIGLLAAVGFCTKPYTIVIFTAIQLTYLIRERSLKILFSIENLIVYVAALLYVAYVCFCMPEYIHDVMPMALATYAAYRNNGLLYPIAAFVIFGISLVDFRFRHRSPFRPDIYYLLWLSVAFLLYALVNNGWGYTYQPLIDTGLLLTLWIIWDYQYLKEHTAADARDQRSFAFGSRACLINLAGNFAYALLGLASFFSVAACDTNIECTKYKLLLAEMRDQHVRSFGVMSGDFHKWAQLARSTGAGWDTRFRHLWMINQFVISGERFTKTHQWILDYLDHAYADDLERNKPDAVFVVTSMGVKLPEFFGRSDAFREAWGHYRFLHTLDLCRHAHREAVMNPDCRYDVYVRSH